MHQQASPILTTRNSPLASVRPAPAVTNPDAQPAPTIHALIPQSSHPLPISALAALLGCTRSTIRHFADRLGFRFATCHIGPRRERMACLTTDQAQAIAVEVERDAAQYVALPPQSEVSPSSSSSSSDAGAPRRSEAKAGLFYLLQLEPQHDPGRFKLGFSTDLESRLDDLLTVVPLAKLIATWPAHRSWERLAILSTAQNAEPISQEVFRCNDIHEAVAAANRFFAVLPKLEYPQTSKDRWFSTTADPHLPQAANIQNHREPGPAGKSEPPSHRPAPPSPEPRPASEHHETLHPVPIPAAPEPASGPPPMLPILHLLPTDPNASPPPAASGAPPPACLSGGFA